MQTWKVFLLSFFVAASAHTSFATIRRVNNMPGVNAPYTTALQAINAASAGDTIHFEASGINYPDVILNKRLVLIGTGYFLDETDANPNTQAIPQPSVIVNLNFAPGSKGSVVQGMTINNSCRLSDSFITLQRNIINVSIELAYNNSSYGDTLRNNYFGSNGRVRNNSNTNQAQGLLVYNNIFTGTGTIVFVNNLANTGGYFINNSFTTTSLSVMTFTCSNFTFQNNIFNRVSFGNLLTANIFVNNIAFEGIPTGNDNVLNIEPEDVYLGWADGTGFSSDGRYDLKVNSPASSAGILNGNIVDCGAFGGPAPYIRSGMPPVPSIYEISMPTQVTSGTTSINVSLSATTEH